MNRYVFASVHDMLIKSVFEWELEPVLERLVFLLFGVMITAEESIYRHLAEPFVHHDLRFISHKRRELPFDYFFSFPIGAGPGFNIEAVRLQDIGGGLF